jgi:hypothetical protein
VSTPIPAKPVDKNGQSSVPPGSGSEATANDNDNEGFHHAPGPHHRDVRDDLRNSFHKPKLNFSCYDGETDPLSLLNRCESYFRGTRTMAVEQV